MHACVFYLCISKIGMALPDELYHRAYLEAIRVLSQNSTRIPVLEQSSGSLQSPSPSWLQSSGPSALQSPGPSGLQSSGPSALQSPGPSGLQSSGPSALQSPGPSWLQSSGPSALQSPGPSWLQSSGPSALQSPGPSALQSPGPSGLQSGSLQSSTGEHLTDFSVQDGCKAIAICTIV